MHTSMRSFRVATLYFEQDHKRWDLRRELVIDPLASRQPDVIAFNEICVPLQTGRWLQRRAHERLGIPYALVQQSNGNGASLIDSEVLLTRYPMVETANWDDQALDMVALVVRLEIEGRVVDVYVTHLSRSRGDHALRLYQVQPLLACVESRDYVEIRVVCGDCHAPLAMPSAQLMASVFRLTQTAPTVFTPFQDTDGMVSHPHWPRFDRCIDDSWVTVPLAVRASGVCCNTPSATDPYLWPSDHAGVWADLIFS
jgi:endonuclease/exonuclease/phosphatase family metal-dependent hydrolase